MAHKDSSKKDNKLFDDQFDDEEVFFVFNKHPVVMRKGLIYAMLGPLIGVIPAFVHPSYGMGVFFGGLLIGIVLGGVIFFPYWIGWHFSVFIVTNQRFIQIKQKGLFNRSISSINLSQIQSVNYEVKGIQETLLGFGTILIQSYVGNIEIHDIHHPARLQKRFLKLLKELNIESINRPYSNINESSNEEIQKTQNFE